MAERGVQVAGTSPITGALSGLIVEAIPQRARKMVNAWLIGVAAFGVGKTLHTRWRERMEYHVTVTGDDDLYEDAHAWLLDNMPAARRKAIKVRSTTSRSRGEDSLTVAEPGVASTPTKPRLRYFYDGATNQQVSIDGHAVKIVTALQEANFTGQGRAQEYEAFYASRNRLTFIGQSTAARDAVLALLDRLASRRADQPTPPRLYLATRWGHWERRDELRPRPASTVVLTDGLAEALFNNVAEFLRSEAEYELLGMPWHKGYLLWGPPGSGKTSIAQALATTFDMDVYWLPVRDLEDDGALLRLIADVRRRCLLLLEDIDVLPASHQREAQDDQPAAVGPSLTGLLNALDGMVTPHGLITVMTANRPDVLDNALTRPGRIDLNFELGPLGKPDLQRLITMLTGEPLSQSPGPSTPERGVLYRTDGIPDDFTAVPGDVVNVVKLHMHDKRAAREALREWIRKVHHDNRRRDDRHRTQAPDPG